MTAAPGLLRGAPGSGAVFDDATATWWSVGALQSAARAAGEQWTTALGGERRLVVLRSRNDLATVIGYLAALEARLPVALLDADMPTEFFAALVARYEPALVVGGDAPVDGYASLSMSSQTEPGVWLRQSGGAVTPHADLTVLLPTSGSTGSARLVRLSRDAVFANADAIAEALAIDEADRAITSLPLHYSYGLSVLNSHLLRGARVLLTAPNVLASHFWDVARSEGCTSLAGVPYSYQLLRRLDLAQLRVPSLRTLTQAGGRLHPDVVRHFHQVMRERDGRFFVMYGQTEATARIAILPSDALPDKLGTVGRAIPGGRIDIVDDDGRSVPTGADGEVVYEGPNVMLGYAESAADLAFGDVQHGRLPTGDLGWLDADGFLTITGRRKRIAKAFGHRINLDDVEAALTGHPPAAVTSLDDAILIVGEGWTSERGDAVRQQLAERYRLHVSAFRVRSVERLPTLASGKPDYAALERAT